MRNSYDPSLKYVFTRPMLWNGKQMSAGDKVSTSKAIPAVLNALVRMRHIEPATATVEEPVTVATEESASTTATATVEEPATVATEESASTTAAEIRRDAPKTYNVYVMGMPMNSESFSSKSAAAEWCESQGLTYNYS